ncbi:unnamed protein product [Brachionus calyciflorus]|uniref:2,4-dienoyl-CoA reductase, mitochondrial n=1 Tax=Brachionus calyciflorus TaxID=104777 RepID=A0A813M5I7_9BILA|nr:unnamed protein product [Brachionus calyciflorus]
MFTQILLKPTVSVELNVFKNSLRLISTSKTLNVTDVLPPPDFSENAKRFPAIKTPMLPQDTFKGKIAFITGGGTGLGKNMALTLSKLGAQVFITSRREQVLKEASEEISSTTKNKVSYFPADVRMPDQIEKSIDHCVQTLGGLPSLIVNNAAGNFISPTERLSPNAVKTIVDIVLLGTLNTTISIGKRLIKENQGASFLNIITTYAETGSGYVVPSACAKAGVVAMTRSLALEWSKYGMRFNGISPGPIYTKGAFSRLDPTGSFVEHAKNRIPAGRLGEADELSNLASYLLSDYANWMTGQIIDMDGGELINSSGEFNYLYSIQKEQWDMMEKMIRQTKSK